MALVGDTWLYLHAPKTAGHAFRHFVAKAGLATRELGGAHACVPELLELEADVLVNRTVITFVRHPLTWYQSMWAFRMKNGWQPTKHPLDYHCASNDFCTFVNRTLDWCPVGWVSWQHGEFVGQIPDNHQRFIGRYEDLVDDTLAALAMAGSPIARPRSVRVNSSDLAGMRSHELAVYDETTKARVLSAEAELIAAYWGSQ